MNASQWDDIPPEEQAVLRSIAQAQLAEQAREEARRTPFEHTYEVEMERLRAAGVEVGTHRFCWLRLRFHKFGGRFMSGSSSYGHSYKLCTRCGHRRVSMYIGGAIPPMVG